MARIDWPMTVAPISHCKLCELADFSDPELRELIRDVYASDREHFGDPDFPAGREYRKYWEVAMTLRAFRSLGVLRDDARVLGVGAGREATVYWLTRHVGRGRGDRPLRDRGQLVRDRLERRHAHRSRAATGTGSGIPSGSTVQHMDALELEFEDDSFDAIFSSSSIEHFGDFPDVRRSVEEMFRVLRPGGVLALATEFRLEGDRIGYPGLLRFDEPELRALLLDGLWWDPATPLDLGISEETVAGAVETREAIADQRAGIRGWSRYPHLVLRHEQFLWTSVHVALVKSGRTSAEWRRRTPELPPKVSTGQKLKRRAYPAVAWGRRRLGRGEPEI